VRVVEGDRRLLARGDLAVPGAEVVTSGWVAAVLDRHRIPDGFPFVVDDDGTMCGCRRLNGSTATCWMRGSRTRSTWAACAVTTCASGCAPQTTTWQGFPIRSKNYANTYATFVAGPNNATPPAKPCSDPALPPGELLRALPANRILRGQDKADQTANMIKDVCAEHPDRWAALPNLCRSPSGRFGKWLDQLAAIA
jgi:hypothetical protein